MYYARGKTIIIPSVAALVVGILASITGQSNNAIARSYDGARTPGVAPATPDFATAFVEVAESIAPSVVSIRSVKEMTTSAGDGLTPTPPRFFFDSPFRGTPFDDLFGERFFERLEPHRQPGRGFLQRGEGSGVIVSEDGYVLTNSHVVSDAQEVTVILNDDRQYSAEVVGTDARTDLAIIKIDSDGLQAATLGDSGDLRVGQWVVAAGSPFGLSSTITAGIVSATGRSRVGVADYEDFIQTDAAINPGNSGGPLVNLRGEVVGINTAIFSRAGGNNGIGFAIPISMAKLVMDQLIADGKVVRGYLGVLIQDLSKELAGSFGYDSTAGALISEITDDGPAANAGLKAGDIVTHFNGARVENVDRLKLAVAEIDPGTRVNIRVFRDGEARAFEVEIAEMPAAGTTTPVHESSNLNIGMTVETLTPVLARELGIASSNAGVVVTSVEPLGPAARSGLQFRDVITHVHEAAVQDVDAFRRELRKHDLNDGVRLIVKTGNARRFVYLQLRD